MPAVLTFLRLLRVVDLHLITGCNVAAALAACWCVGVAFDLCALCLVFPLVCRGSDLVHASTVPARVLWTVFLLS